ERSRLAALHAAVSRTHGARRPVTESRTRRKHMPEQTQASNGGSPNGAEPSAHHALPASSLEQAQRALAAPFPGSCIGFLPSRLGANSQWAVVFPYVDVTAIQDRLDLVVGPARWSHEVRAIDETTLA